MPFLNVTLSMTTAHDAPDDVRVFFLNEPLRYFCPALGRTFRILEASTSDGVSDPKLLQLLLARYGRAFWEAILHDALFHQTAEEMRPDGTWFSPDLSLEEKNAIFGGSMIEAGFPASEVWAVVESLDWFGEAALEADLKMAIPRIPPLPPLNAS